LTSLAAASAGSCSARRPRGDLDAAGAGVSLIRTALDQPVALHPGERRRHGRLLDIEAANQILLRQPFLAPELEQHHELRRSEAERAHCLGELAGEQPGDMVGEIAGGAGLEAGHARLDPARLQLNSMLCNDI
jgi:hypothetical protein